MGAKGLVEVAEQSVAKAHYLAEELSKAGLILKYQQPYFRKFVLLIPLIYLIPHLVSNPVIGVYMAEPIADIIAVLFTSALFSFQFKKTIAEIQN